MRKDDSRFFVLCGLALATALALVDGACSASADTFHAIHNFCDIPSGCVDGRYPVAGLAMDQAGNLYGTTPQGGFHRYGTVFKLVPRPGKVRWKEQVLYDFCALDGCADGNSPDGALIVDSAGNLYGTTSGGGAKFDGTIFELSPVAGTERWTHKILYSFCSKDDNCTDGTTPIAGLTYSGAASGAPYDGVSTLYGTASAGGSHLSGTAFTFRHFKGGWVEHPIYEFCSERREACADGSAPSTRLLVGSAGTLYGTTLDGGANQAGTVFELTSVSGSKTWALTVLHSFCAMPNCADGQFPSSALVMDNAGNLFGATSQGGAGAHCSEVEYEVYSCGTIYTVAPDGDEAVIYNFCSRAACSDGIRPQGDLAINESGSLFGTTAGDAASVNGDTLFELTGSSLSVLHSFCLGNTAPSPCPAGKNQYGVMLDGSGNLFGVSALGGVQDPREPGFPGSGNVFEWSLAAAP